MNRLAETLGTAGDVPASWICAAMAETLRGNTDDDITVITLRRL
jgi:two-component system, chemotaxis family, sensor kinase Cph1